MNETSQAAPRTSPSFYRWLSLISCFLIVSIIYGAGFSFGVFLNPLKESFGTTAASISAVYSITLWTFAVSGIVSGWAVDRFGPCRSIIAGAFLLGSGCVLSSFVHSLWQLYLTSALMGIGLSSGYSPTMATVSRTFEGRRGLALGVNSAGVGFGPLIMAPLQTQLILTGGWRFTFLFTACTVGLVIPIALLLGRFQRKLNLGPGQVLHHAPSPRPNVKLSEAFRTRFFWLICLVFLTIGIGVQTVVAHIAAYSQYQGTSPMMAAAVLSCVTGVSMAGRMVMGTASDWIGRRNALAICTFFEGLALIFLMMTPYTWALFVFGVVFGFSYGGHAPQLPALVGETLGFENMGALLGTANAFWGLGSAIGPFMTGYLFDVTGGYTAGFSLATVAILAASANGFFLLRSSQKPSAIASSK